ncbi:MAG: hypothetical protein WC087_01225 [Candidatus Paceibacterota bacterium]
MDSEQVSKLISPFSDRLREISLKGDSFELAVSKKGEMIVEELLAVTLKYVGLFEGIFSIEVEPDYELSYEEVLDSTGCTVRFVDEQVIETMPKRKPESKSLKVFFFQLAEKVYIEDLPEEYKLRDLIPVDPYALAEINEDKFFSEQYPNGTYWEDSDGKICYMLFELWVDGRAVVVRRSKKYLEKGFWCAGIEK